MSSSPTARGLDIRVVQVARAVVAAVAAVAITFSADHSAPLGLVVFGSFAIATGVVLLVARALVPAVRGVATVALGVLSVVAGIVALVPGIRSVALFFALVIVWALATGVVETVAGWRAHRALRDGTGSGSAQRRSEARDAMTVGVLTVVLGLALLFVPGQYVLHYYAVVAHRSFTLTGITIGVGVFGGYAAVAAVYLAIAAFSPRRVDAIAPAAASLDRPGGVA